MAAWRRAEMLPRRRNQAAAAWQHGIAYNGSSIGAAPRASPIMAASRIISHENSRSINNIGKKRNRRWRPRTSRPGGSARSAGGVALLIGKRRMAARRPLGALGQLCGAHQNFGENKAAGEAYGGVSLASEASNENQAAQKNASRFLQPSKRWQSSSNSARRQRRMPATPARYGAAWRRAIKRWRVAAASRARRREKRQRKLASAWQHGVTA